MSIEQNEHLPKEMPRIPNWYLTQIFEQMNEHIKASIEASKISSFDRAMSVVKQ